MAIRAKHVQDEIKKAEEVTVNGTIVEKVVVKLLTVVLRVLLTVRLNQVKLMEKLGVEKIQPRLPRTDETKQPSVQGEPTTISATNDIEDVENK